MPVKLDQTGQPFGTCSHKIAASTKKPNPSVEMMVTGVQNRRTLTHLPLSRLAAKKNAKNKMAKIPTDGVKVLNAVNPIALALLWKK